MKNERGYTIWELLSPIVLISIMASLMLPSFGELIKEQRLRQMASELRMGISIARSEGVKRASIVSFVPNSTWSQGWCVEIDPDATTCTSLNVHKFVAENGSSVSSSKNSIQFNDWGRTPSCPKFQITRDNCSICMSVTADGRVMSSPGTCPSSCPSSSNETAWSESCQ